MIHDFDQDFPFTRMYGLYADRIGLNVALLRMNATFYETDTGNTYILNRVGQWITPYVIYDQTTPGPQEVIISSDPPLEYFAQLVIGPKYIPNFAFVFDGMNSPMSVTPMSATTGTPIYNTLAVGMNVPLSISPLP